MDERTKRKLEETATVVLGLFYFICPIEMIVKLIVTDGNSSILGEIIIFLTITFTFLIIQRFHRSYSPQLPRKSNGEELSTEKTSKAKIKRLLMYAKESLLFSISFIVISIIMDHILKKQELTWNLEFFTNQLLNLLLIFMVIFIINTFLKEQKIKRYDKWNENLEK